MADFLGLDTQDTFEFDVLVNIGTLSALLVYFRRDLLRLVVDFFKGETKARRMAVLLILATIPAAVLGYLFDDFITGELRSPLVVAAMLVLVGLAMLFVERTETNGRADKLTIGRALGIGFAQALALIPGTSRSGATITTGKLLGLSRSEAARFSFLLSIPIMFGALLKTGLEQETISYVESNYEVVAAGVVAAAASGYAAVSWLLRYISTHSLKAFAYYRIGIAVVIIAWHVLL